jgi:hypothetical protein
MNPINLTVSPNAKRKGEGKEAAILDIDPAVSQKVAPQPPAKHNSEEQAIQSFQDDDSATTGQIVAEIVGQTDEGRQATDYPFVDDWNDEGRHFTEYPSFEERLKEAMDTDIYSITHSQDQASSSKTPPQNSNSSFILTSTDLKNAFKTIRPTLADLVGLSGYQQNSPYTTEIGHGRFLSGEIEGGNLKFRFRIVGEDEDFAVPFEVKVISQLALSPEKKSRKWCHFFGKPRTRKGKQRARNGLYKAIL